VPQDARYRETCTTFHRCLSNESKPALPFPVVAPAAVASLAYLNARWSVNNDWRILSALARARIRQARLERKGRLNVFYSLEEFALSRRTADLPFLVFEGKTWSFREAYDMVLRFASWLHNNHGVKPREIVALDFVNCPQFVFLWLALWSLGAIPAFINYNLTGSPLIHSIRVSTARILIIDPDVQHVLTPEVEAELTSSTFLTDNPTTTPLKIIPFTATLQSSLPYHPPFRAPDSARSTIRPRDPAILVSTSGTTGLPKPAIVSWNKILVAARYCTLWVGLRPASHRNAPDRWYCCMPLYHSSASVLGFCGCLINGTTFVLGRRFSASGFWGEVRRGRATVVQYVGEMCRYLVTAPPERDPRDPGRDLDKQHNVRMAFGNGLRPDVWERFQARFGIETIAELYAATEGTSGAWNLSSNSFAAGAVGRNGVLAGLMIGREVCVVKVDYSTEMPYRDPETGLCVQMPRGEPGEVLYKLDERDVQEKFQGYYNSPGATSSKIIRDVLTKGDAYFRTGDILRWDSEGRWWFVDRIGDTFRWKSENVSTAEVAEILGRHPRVLEANVYGVEVPGYEGRAGCAAVMFDENYFAVGKEAEKEETMESLATFLKNSLPSYAVPVFLRVVKDMERTGNLKQTKQVLRQEGADWEKVVQGTGEELWWLPRSSTSFVRFGKEDWDRMKAGKAKL
jgi:acyl-CoA synthetase (AMP-forming)/AMP-acid ligase II